MNFQARIEPNVTQELTRIGVRQRIKLSEFSWIWLALTMLVALSAVLAPGTLRPSSISDTIADYSLFGPGHGSPSEVYHSPCRHDKYGYVGCTKGTSQPIETHS